MNSTPEPVDVDFDRLLKQFRQSLEDCQGLYLAGAQEVAQRYPESIKQNPADFVALMQDLHRGLVTKIFVEIGQADWRWTSQEYLIAAELFDHVWGARPPADQVASAVEQAAEQVGTLSWISLVRPFTQFPPLKEQTGALLTIVVRLANLVAKADGCIDPKELRRLTWIQEQLQTLLVPIPVHGAGDDGELALMGEISVDGPPGDGRPGAAPGKSVSAKLGPAQRSSAKTSGVKAESLDSVLSELNGLIGLAGIKQEVQELVNFLKIQGERKKRGMPCADVSLHMVYRGNPGTGKTTVARLMGRIFGAMEILAKGHLIETDRSGLVAQYAGQTGPKTNQKIDESLDGVLFIDEAYSLVADKGDDPYGAEAVQTLLKRVEDDRRRLVVALAGYPAPMDRMLATNPGLSSRFHRTFDFPDYSAAELGQIFQGMCEKNHYVIPARARWKLLLGFKHLLERRDEQFGNGRLARNIFEGAIRRLANRIAKIAPLTPELLTTFEAEDIAMPGVPPELDESWNDPSRRLESICPGCRQAIRFRPHALGQRVRCKRCQHEFRMDWGEPIG